MWEKCVDFSNILYLMNTFLLARKGKNMAQNNFILDLIAGLNKTRSKQQIKADVKALGDIYVKLIGNLNMTKTRQYIKNQLKGLNNMTFKMTPTVNTKGVQNAMKQSINTAQKVANNNKIHYSFDMDKKKLQDQLRTFSKENSKLFSSKEMTAKYNQLLNLTNIAKSKSELNALRKQLSAFRTELIATNKAGMTWTDKFKASISHFAQYFSGASFIYAITNQARKATTEAKTLDDSLVDLQKVTSEIADRDALYKYFDKAMSKAQELNVKVGDLIDAITEFKKLGWSLSDAELGAEWATKLANVGDVDIETAIGSIKTSIASFDEIGGYGDDQLDKKLEAYVDLINNMSNKYSIDAEGLAESIRLSAGTLTEAHTSVEQAATMFATANKYYNDPSYLGNTAKIGSLRMRASTGDTSAIEELQEMGEEVDDLAEATSKLREKLLALTGVDIMVDDHTFKSYYQQLFEISQVIDQLDDTSRANVLETMFGKARAAGGAAILSGMKESATAYQDAINSAGSATQEYETWMQSADAATQRFSNNLIQTYQQFINGNTVRDLANFGSAILEFANKFGIIEGTLKGFLALKIGTFLTNATMAFLSATKQVEQYGKALQMVNNIPNGNLSQRFATLKSIAQATSTLTTAQLKQVLSNQALTQSDRIRILMMQGMTREMALQKLAEMNLTQTTNAQTAANVAQTASTFSLKSAMIGLGATIKSVFLSNPIGIALMAISIGVSAVTSAVSSHNQKMEELRQKAKEAADEANTLGDEIADLTSKYIQLSEAVKTDSSAKEDLMSTQTELLKKLGLEGEGIDALIEKYGSLSEAIKQASIDSLQNARIDLLAGVNAAKEELLDVGKDGFWGGNNIINATGDDAVKAFKELEKAGIVSSGSYGSAGGALVLIGDDTTTEGILENYERLEKGLAALRDSNVFTAEELSDNSLYQAMYARYSEMTEVVNNYKGAIGDLNENVAQETMLTALQGKEIPKTEEEFETFRQELIDTAVASKQFIGNEKEITDAINNYLSTVPQFEGFYSVPLENELDKVDELLGQETFSILSFSEVWSNLQASTDDATKGIADNLTELAEKGQLTVEALSEADTTDFFKNAGISAEEAVKKINELVSASTQLQSMSAQISKMSDMLADKKNGTIASASDLAGFDAEVRGLDSWKEFESVMGSTTSTMEECQAAANALASEWINNGNFLANLTDQNRDYYETQLSNMGIENAHVIVLENLAKAGYELSDAEQAELDKAIQAREEIYALQLQEAQDFIAKKDLKIAAEDAYVGLMQEAEGAGISKVALVDLIAQEQVFNNSGLSVSSKISQLSALASAYLGTASAAQFAANTSVSGMGSDPRYFTPDYVMEQWTNALSNYKVNFDLSPSGSSGYKGGASKSSSSGSGSNSKQTIDWIERKLTVLQSKIDTTKAKFDNLFTLKSKKNNLATQIKQTTTLLNATNKAADIYLKKANSVGLSTSLKKKVQSGSYNINDYSSETADKIQKYEDYYDKYKELKQQANELETDIRSLREERYQLYVDDAEAKIERSQALAELDSGNYKKQNVHLEAQKKYLEQEYKYLIKIAELNKDSVEVAKLKAELQKELNDLTKQEFDNIANTYDNKISFTDNKVQAFQDQIDLLEAKGQQVGSALYTKQISLNNANTEKLVAEREKLIAKLAEIPKGTDGWYDAQDTLFDVDSQLVQIEIDNANLQKSINQLKFDRFDDLLTKLNDIVDETDFLIGMLDSDNLFDDNGKITDDGITAMGLTAQNYDVYLAEAEKYKQMLADVKDMYDAGSISLDEYEEYQRKYSQSQRDAIKSANDCKDALVDLVEQGLNAQNRALEEAVNKQKELLQQEKD